MKESGKDSEMELEAKKVFVKTKHELHEGTLRKLIEELQNNLERYSTYDGPESIFVHVKTNAAALLFLLQERKRDRDKRKDYTQPVTPLPIPGSDIE
ncbi:MAG TPA: hypothetical protein PLA83_12130 [Deltaproteobacteria bacterium]|mgnify:CR=1 FL=1|jgi:hypothetical protein|nr:hypothetical protein [Deltaproteobacteria bacterium]HQI00378.1 hypothetical protein [Deltaproteobacteria bacterium]HQJ09519.1 hypothetical protein [Deltaproteobacteria bacterium]